MLILYTSENFSMIPGMTANNIGSVGPLELPPIYTAHPPGIVQQSKFRENKSFQSLRNIGLETCSCIDVISC